MTTINLDKRVLNEEETSEYIGMSRSYLRQARMEGIRKNRKIAPPFIKIGRAVRYLREDLDQWLTEQVKLQHLPCNGGDHA